MKIIVIGASKGIGRQTVKAALEKGHTVSAFSRNPAVLGIQHPHLHLRVGNVLDAPSLTQAMAGHDAVICTLGLPTMQAMGLPFVTRSYVLSEGTRNILQAMADSNTKRLICVTAIGAGDSVRQCTPLARVVLRSGLRWLFKEKDVQERLIRNSSGINWTIIRPTALTNGHKKGALVGKNLRSGVLTHISRADVAAIMIAMVDQKTSYHQALVLSYPAKFGDTARWIAGYFGVG